METLDNIYILAVKNKQLIPAALLLVLGMMTGKRIDKKKDIDLEYLGDNIPLDLLEKLKHN